MDATNGGDATQRRQPRADQAETPFDDVAKAIEALHLTIGVSTRLLDDPWFGERARSRILQGRIELATLEAELAHRAGDRTPGLKPAFPGSRAA